MRRGHLLVDLRAGRRVLPTVGLTAVMKVVELVEITVWRKVEPTAASKV